MRNYEVIKIAGLRKDAVLSLRGFGGSDLGTAFGYNNYKRPWTAWMEHIQEFPYRDVDNRFIYRGERDEPQIVRMFKHYDAENPDPDQIITDVRAGKIFSKASATPYLYIYRKDPRMTALPDALISQSPFWEGKGVLECKSRGSNELAQYKNGILTKDFIQAAYYCGILGRDYFVIGYLIDGATYEYHYFKHDPNVFGELILQAQIYLNNRDKALGLKKSLGLERYLHAPEPDLADIDAWDMWDELKALEPQFERKDLESIREFYPDAEQELQEMDASEHQVANAKEYWKLSNQIDLLQQSKAVVQEALIRSLQGKDLATDGDGKTVFSYKEDRTGKRRPYVSKKIKKELEDAKLEK